MIETISHYRITSKLGSGGMGEVYLAEDLNLRRPVAIKVLPEDFVRDEHRKQRFMREAHAASEFAQSRSFGPNGQAIAISLGTR